MKGCPIAAESPPGSWGAAQWERLAACSEKRGQLLMSERKDDSPG